MKKYKIYLFIIFINIAILVINKNIAPESRIAGANIKNTRVSAYSCLSPAININKLNAKEFISHKIQADKLLDRIKKRFNLNFSEQNMIDFKDTPIDSYDLAITLLPILKYLTSYKPEIVLGLSNGADPLVGQLQDMAKEYKDILDPDFQPPQYTNLIFGRQFSLPEIFWANLTEKERITQITSNQRLKLKAAIDFLNSRLQTTSSKLKSQEYFTVAPLIDKTKSALSSLKESLESDLTLGEFILKLNTILPKGQYSLHSKSFLNFILPELKPFFEELLKDIKLKAYFQGKKILIIDEIAYSGDALIKTKIFLELLDAKEYEFNLLIDYTESINEYKPDPIGNSGLKELGINVSQFGRNGKSAIWKLVNIDMGPIYSFGDKQQQIENIRDGYGLEKSIFGEILFELFTSFLDTNDQKDTVSNIENEINIRSFFALRLQKMLTDMKIMRKTDIPWKHLELKKTLSEIQKKNIEKFDAQLKKFILYLLYSDPGYKPMSKQREAWISLRFCHETLTKIKKGEELLLTDNDFRRLSELYLTNKKDLNNIILFMQYAHNQLINSRKLSILNIDQNFSLQLQSI